MATILGGNLEMIISKDRDILKPICKAIENLIKEENRTENVEIAKITGMFVPV